MTDAPDFDDLLQARARLDGVALRTPLLGSSLLDERLGMRLLVKPECLQLTGAFKFRGAYNALARQLDRYRRTGIVAYSGGNHAQGAAAAAAMLGIDCIVLMPSDAPPMKIERTRAFGAAVQLHDRWTEDRDLIAADIVARTGRVLIPSFDHPDIIAGQGTIGLEIAEQCAALGAVPDVVLMSCGGGGLCAGVSLALKTMLPGTRVLGVEPVDFDDTRRSLQTGVREANASDARSICDALLTRCGALTLSMNLQTLDGVLTVTDDAVRHAMRTLFTDFKLVAEPGGAAAMAAVLAGSGDHGIEPGGRTVVVVVSGGNVEREQFSAVLASG